MTEGAFKKLFAQFLNDYWGAFHEALEAQSVTPKRLAGSLFETLQAEHRAFEAMYAGTAKNALEALDRIWRDLSGRRYQFPDASFTHDEVVQARRRFEELYDSLVREGHQFPVARTEILEHAAHGSPKEPLRADAAR